MRSSVAGVLLGVAMLLGVGAGLGPGATVAVAASAQATSMSEAHNLARVSAFAWDSRARLYEVHSADSLNVTDSNQGLDGKRVNWYVDYVVPGTNRHFSVFVSKGRVAAETAYTNPTLWTPFDEFPTMPLADIMAHTKARSIQPSTNVAFGYHFRLHKHDGRPTLTVLGQDQSGRRKGVNFNPQTGEAYPDTAATAKTVTWAGWPFSCAHC